MKTFRFILLLSVFVTKSFAQPFSLTATIPHDGSYANGEYQIFRSSSNGSIALNNLRNPIIFVEGFDVNNTDSIHHIQRLLYFNSNNLGTRLNNLGHDIIILNFSQGGDYIQKNAFLLVELIKQINLQKPNQSDSLIVVGFSMGGLVARYALMTYMEQNETVTGAHKTRLFASFDSPHKGAHVPACIQAFALTFSAPIYSMMFPDLAEAMSMFTAPAATQMLKYRISSPSQTDTEIPISAEHTAFMDELNNLNDCNGFPEKCRNIALSLGSWNGVGQRSNLDLDSNNVADLQHSGFPLLYINMPQGSGEGPTWVGNMNTCQMVASILFQSVLATTHSIDYPHYSQRSSYANLGNYVYATYWYVNPNGFPIAPVNSFSRFWTYEDYVPIDFAPGSFTPSYSMVLNAFSSIVDCSYGYANNSTFIPTISALAFDTENLFYNISADTNKLDKTPFEAIYGIDGDNTSHTSNQVSNSVIINALIDEISNNYGFTYAKNHEILSGIVSNGQDIAVSDVSSIEASNYTLMSGSNVSLEAFDEIVLGPGFQMEVGSEFSAKISKCTFSKACSWHPTSIRVNTPSMHLHGVKK